MGDSKEIILTEGEKATVQALLDDVGAYKLKEKKNDLIARPLGWFEQRIFLKDSKIKADLIKRLIEINGPFEEVIPDDLVEISPVRNAPEGKPGNIWAQYLRKGAYEDFQRMSNAIKDSGQGEIMVQSGYRSPTFQAIVYMQHLVRYGWDFKEASKRCAFPSESQHCSSTVAAVDVITTKLLKNISEVADFDQTSEFAWLSRNADKFNYSMPYPKDNKEGKDYEPWHWKWEPLKSLK